MNCCAICILKFLYQLVSRPDENLNILTLLLKFHYLHFKCRLNHLIRSINNLRDFLNRKSKLLIQPNLPYSLLCFFIVYQIATICFSRRPHKPGLLVALHSASGHICGSTYLAQCHVHSPSYLLLA